MQGFCYLSSFEEYHSAHFTFPNMAAVAHIFFPEVEGGNNNALLLREEK